MITAIDKITPINAKGENKPQESSGLESIDSFATIFRSAVDNVKETNADMVEAEYLLSVGELDNPAALTIATSKYSLSVELLVQLRNKALEAYNGLINMSM